MVDEIVIKLPREQAERLSYTISDLLCWLQGFRMGHKIGNTFGEDTSKIVDEEDFRKLNLQLKDILHERDKADKEFIAQQSEMVDLIGGDVLAKLMTNQVFAPGALNAIIAREMEVAVVCDNLVVRRKYPYKRKK